MVVIVDGVESDPSDPPIKVVKIEKDRKYYTRLTIEIISTIIGIISFIYINVPSFA
jgi:hypothetical protein